MYGLFGLVRCEDLDRTQNSIDVLCIIWDNLQGTAHGDSISYRTIFFIYLGLLPLCLVEIVSAKEFAQIETGLVPQPLPYLKSWYLLRLNEWVKGLGPVAIFLRF